MYCCMTWMFPAGMFNGSAICGAMPERFCVEMCTVISFPLGHSAAMPWVSRQQWVMHDAP